MIENEHTAVDVDEGKGVEVGSRVNESERTARMPKGASTDKGTVGEASPIEGDDKATDQSD